MKDVDLKIEALRYATLIMCQSVTAGKGNDTPESAEVLVAAKTFYEWFKNSKQ